MCSFVVCDSLHSMASQAQAVTSQRSNEEDTSLAETCELCIFTLAHLRYLTSAFVACCKGSKKETYMIGMNEPSPKP